MKRIDKKRIKNKWGKKSNEKRNGREDCTVFEKAKMIQLLFCLIFFLSYNPVSIYKVSSDFSIFIAVQSNSPLIHYKP